MFEDEYVGFKMGMLYVYCIRFQDGYVICILYNV